MNTPAPRDPKPSPAVSKPNRNLHKIAVLAAAVFVSELGIMNLLPLFGLEGLWENLLDSGLLTVVLLPWLLFLFPLPKKRSGPHGPGRKDATFWSETTMWATLGSIMIALLATAGFAIHDSHQNAGLKRGTDRLVHQAQLLYDLERTLRGGTRPEEDAVTDLLTAMGADPIPVASLQEAGSSAPISGRGLVLSRGIRSFKDRFRDTMAQVGAHMQRSDGFAYWTGISIFVILVLAGLLAVSIRRVIQKERRTEALARSREVEISVIMDQADSAILAVDEDGRITSINRAARELFGLDGREPPAGLSLADLLPELPPPVQSGRAEAVETTAVRRGERFPVQVVQRLVDRGAKARVLVVRDLETERRELAQKTHSQKMEAIGQLAAGIAHEINTPTQYVGDNIRFLEETFGELVPVLERTEGFLAEITGRNDAPQAAKDLKAGFEDLDLAFLKEEIPNSISQSLDGVGRISKIVSAMKSFSHPGREELTDYDLNDGIKNTVVVATNEWKYVAEVETDLDPDLPLVPCYPGELNQVVLNLIVNAAHAIAAKVGDGSRGKGKITLRTRRDGDHVELRISDTGTGIPREIADRVFEPFFTTKEVGKGTGQGLHIAHNVIVKKHGGTIHFETEEGKGTTFVIRLPLARPSQTASAQPAGVEGALAGAARRRAAGRRSAAGGAGR